MRDTVPWFLALAGSILVLWFIFCFWFYIVGFRLAYEFKWRYIKAILQQDVEWYESQDTNEIPSKYNTHIADVEASSGRNVALMIFGVGCLFSGILWSFLAGAVLACCFLLCIVYTWILGVIQTLIIEKKTKNEELVFHKSGADAEQALNHIKIVKAFGRENYESEKYKNHLETNKDELNKYSMLYGFSFGIVESLRYMFSFYGLLIGGVFIIVQVSATYHTTQQCHAFTL